MKLAIAAAAALLLTAGAARAEVAEQTETTFRTRNVVEISAPPAKVYAAMGEIGRWWSSAHTYSGKASNLTMPLKAGGCFCEALPDGGSVAHGTVAIAWPTQGLFRINGALGPLQEQGVSGALTFQLRPKGAATEVVQVYAVGGAKPGLPQQYAAPVDQVVREQLLRLEKFVETGKPD